MLINFFYLKDGRLFEVGANSRLVAYLNTVKARRTVVNRNHENMAIK